MLHRISALRLEWRTIIKWTGTSIFLGSYFYLWAQRMLIKAPELPPRKMESVQKQRPVTAAVKYVWRFLKLFLIFLPNILLLPLLLFAHQLWIRLFLIAIQRAGIVWIKCFQYLSHRRDIVGKEVADTFLVLRDNAPLHSLQQTREIFKRLYGKLPEQYFQEFDLIPVASGSVSQVYKARLRGKDVAVKVRHPNVEKDLQRDIDLLFFFSRVASFFSNKAEIPVRTESLKRILKEQIYFLKQKDNLEAFRRLPRSRMLDFPQAWEQSTDEVLIEDFVTGQSIAVYEKKKHPLNRVIAMQGAKAFFQMLLQHNLIHADCHAGNIMIRLKEDDSFWLVRKARLFWTLALNYIRPKLLAFEAPVLRGLAQDNRDYERSVLRDMDFATKVVDIVLIDVGMVVSLTPQKKRSFKQFLKEIIQGDAKKCALWIHRISQRNGVQLRDEEELKYLQSLEEMFTKVHKVALSDLQGITVLQQMLTVIREHHMQIDGEISILLTNMLVLQAIAKDLDPSINILRCAVPYLHYA